MLEQAFTNDSITKCIKKSDITSENYHIIDEIVQNSLERVTNGFEENYFSNKLIRNSKLVHQPQKLSDKLIIRKIANNIKGITSVKQQNRDLIISNLKTLLQENFPFTVIKLDIKSFYESVNISNLLTYLNYDVSISSKTKKLLQSLLNYYSLQGFSGLPRGLSVSAILGEYVLKDFDKKMKRDERFYFYSRFVDDIIILSTDHFEKEDLPQLFPLPFNLKYNKKKIDTFKIPKPNNSHDLIESEFTFLGYTFKVENHKFNQIRKLTISIADKKIKKIKTRLCRSFYNFKKNGDFILLKNRIKLMTSNYNIYKHETNKTIKVGVYYSNQYISSNNELKILDDFLSDMITSDGSKYLRTKLFLSKTQKKNLLKYSFKSGFKNKIFYNFSTSLLADIKECWIND